MRLKLALLALLVLLLASCNPSGKSTPTALPPTPAPAPTLTATPVALPLTILVLPSSMPKADYDHYQTVFYDMAQAAGLRFQVRNSLTPADVALEGPALKLVVAFPPDPGLSDLAAAAPSAQFLAINVPGLTAGGNLSTVGAKGVPVDQQAFLAGYIAALVAPEWKVGMLYPADSDAGTTARDAFQNGFVFYCGSCRNPVFSQPAGIYPVIYGIPATASENEYTAYADDLTHYAVKAAYVFPDLATPTLMAYMTQIGLLTIGETMPDGADASKWVASIQPDLFSAVQKIVPELLAGQGGQDIPTPLFLTQVNSALLSQGKLRLAQQVLDGLQSGTISTRANP